MGQNGRRVCSQWPSQGRQHRAVCPLTMPQKAGGKGREEHQAESREPWVLNYNSDTNTEGPSSWARRDKPLAFAMARAQLRDT